MYFNNFVIIICTGQLRPPGILSSSFVNDNDSRILFWEQPFSLNLTNADPDVVYIIEIYRLNTTCFDHQYLKHSEMMFQPYFEFTQPPFPYEVIVTPRSNVEGARNGTSSTYSGNNSNKHLRIYIYIYIYTQFCSCHSMHVH